MNLPRHVRRFSFALMSKQIMESSPNIAIYMICYNAQHNTWSIQTGGVDIDHNTRTVYKHRLVQLRQFPDEHCYFVPMETNEGEVVGFTSLQDAYEAIHEYIATTQYPEIETYDIDTIQVPRDVPETLRGMRFLINITIENSEYEYAITPTMSGWCLGRENTNRPTLYCEYYKRSYRDQETGHLAQEWIVVNLFDADVIELSDIARFKKYTQAFELLRAISFKPQNS